jgi:hypothetical protein
LVDFDMTRGDDVWFAWPQLFCSCSLCPAGRWQDTSSHREVSLVFFSPQTAACRGMVSLCQWFTNRLPPSAQHSISAQWKTVWVEFPSFRATSREIFTVLFRTAFNCSFNTMLLLVLLLIPGKTSGRAAGFSRSTSGCGATGGHCPERFRSRLQRRCAGSAFENQSAGEWKL